MSRESAIFLIPFGIILISAVIAHFFGIDFGVSATYFDTGWYNAIREVGYSNPKACAFFPGFPFLWSALSLSSTGIAFFNLMIWLLGLLMLKRFNVVHWKSIAFAMLAPAVVFFMVPYSESLFFISTLLVILGLQRDDVRLTMIGVFLCALIRPTAAVLIPALFIGRWLADRKVFQAMARTLFDGLAGMLAVGVVFFIQRLETGNWLAFFEAQKTWGNGLSAPGLTLQTWGGDVITQLDGAAMFVGLMCIFVLIQVGFKKYTLNAIQLFGLAAIGGTTLLVFFTRNGFVFSLNRFIFATAFFPLALDAFRNVPIQKKHWKWLILTWLVFSLYLSSYLHFKSFIVSSSTGALILFTLFSIRSKQKWAQIIGMLSLAVIAIWMIIDFYLKGNWIA
ncbi:MAG: hypothetical protein ACI80P_001759 [Flavobacteriales bacterium]|jgi:hypothetical protein